MLDIFHTEAEYEIQPVHLVENELACICTQSLTVD